MPEPLKPAQPVEQDKPVQTEPAPPRDKYNAAMRPPGRVARWWNKLPIWQRAVLLIVIMSAMVAGAFFAPPEGDSNNVTGDLPNTPTVVAVDIVESVTIGRSFEYNGVQVTVQNAVLATKFSDDHNRGGMYTLRVTVQTKNPSTQDIGVPYNDLFRLATTNGTTIAPKRLGIMPQEQPNSSQTGFVDFPLDKKVPLSTFTLHFGGKISVPFRQ